MKRILASLKRNKIALILYFVITIVVYRVWLFGTGVLTNGDWGYFAKETMTTLRGRYFTLWLSDVSFGRVLVDLGQAPTYAAYGWLANLNLSYGLIERIVHFWPIIFLTPIGSYLMLRKILRSQAAAIVGTMVFSFNTYILGLQTGGITLAAAFALGPICLLLFQKTLETFQLRYAIETGLLLSLCSAYEPRSFYIIAWVLFFYFIWNFFSEHIVNFKWHRTFKLGVYAFIPFVIYLGINTYWILGLSASGGLSNNAVTGRELFGSGFWSLAEALTLHNAFWSGSKLLAFMVSPIPIYFWLIPIFAFLGLFLNRRNKQVVFFGLIALLGILLAKQTDQPFSGIYPWLFAHLPGFSAYREASKFYFLIALGYSVLIGAFVDWLWANWSKPGWRVVSTYALTGLVAALFLWNTKPLITGEIGTLFVPHQEPADYLVLKNFIQKQPEYFRTYWVPIASRWGLYTDNHPKISGADVIAADWKQFVDFQEHDYSWPQQDQIVDILARPYAEQLFDSASVKYVIVPLQDTASDDDFYIYYGDDRSFYIKALNDISWLKRVNIGTSKLAVYENKSFQPHVTTTSHSDALSQITNPKLDFNGDEVPAHVDETTVSATKQSIQIQDSSKPFWLNFGEAFSSGWKLYLRPISQAKPCTPVYQYTPLKLPVTIAGAKPMTSANNGAVSQCHNSLGLSGPSGIIPLTAKPIFDNTHVEFNGYANGWKIDPAYIKANFPRAYYSENADGGITMNMDIYFRPQTFFYYGIAISGATLLVSLGYLGYAWHKRHERSSS